MEVQRKVQLILKVLSESPEPLGARIISRELSNYGVDLSERAVRYHLKLMDERGLTRLVGREGRLITERGDDDLKNALVVDRIGFVIHRIQVLAFRTTFDPLKASGDIVTNISLFPAKRFKEALKAMQPVFKAGLCVSDRVAAAKEGQRLGHIIVPPGKVGLATVCSITTHGVLLKAGIPMGSRFGGILEMRQARPYRFTELITYEGSTLDPFEIFISGGMTSVSEAARTGGGRVLANLRDMPAQCRGMAQELIARLEECGIRGTLILGEAGSPVCEIPVGLDQAGVVLLGGLNPVAAAVEAGIPADNTAMAGILEYNNLFPFSDLV
ncbi:MAG: NrpR regulatory domain-containing protein [Dehalococcoidia bacterium]|nr:NrpR regulatory domain-containing protein [Dehalococcoidia bacterium]